MLSTGGCTNIRNGLKNPSENLKLLDELKKKKKKKNSDTVS